MKCCHAILLRNGLSHSVCKQLLNYLTMDSHNKKLRIKSPYFKELIDFVLEYVTKNKDIQPPNLFDDELFEMIVRIDDGNNQLVPRL